MCFNSCSNKEKENLIYITFDSSVDQIESDIVIKYNEVEVGRIIAIGTDSVNLTAKAKIKENIFIPFGTIFIISEKNFFDDYYIYLELSDVRIQEGRQIYFSGRKQHTVLQRSINNMGIDSVKNFDDIEYIWKIDSLLKSLESQ